MLLACFRTKTSDRLSAGLSPRITLLQERHYCFSIFLERGVRERARAEGVDHEDLRDGIRSDPPSDRQKVVGGLCRRST